MTRGLLLTAVAVAITGAGLLPVEAVTRRQTQEQACYADAMRLCSDFVPDEAKITACMEQKKAQLSAPCAVLFSTDNQ